MGPGHAPKSRAPISFPVERYKNESYERPSIPLHRKLTPFSTPTKGDSSQPRLRAQHLIRQQNLPTTGRKETNQGGLTGAAGSLILSSGVPWKSGIDKAAHLLQQLQGLCIDTSFFEIDLRGITHVLDDTAVDRALKQVSHD